MSRNMFLVSVLTILAVTGCRRQEFAEPQPDTDTVPQPVAINEPQDDEFGWDRLASRDPAAHLVKVDDHVYTVGEALRDVDERLKAMFGDLSEEDMAARRPMLLSRTVDQFVMRCLLLDEADRRGVTISEQEQVEAYDKIRASLPPDTTLEEVMRKSPMGEERMRKEVLVGVRINKLLESVLNMEAEVSDEEIDAFVAEHPDVTMPETVAARHILLKTEEDDSPERKAERLAKAQALRGQLLEGADFETLARDNSDCPSAQRGGDLGVFRRGQMVKPFEDAAFTQEPGQVGEIVETQFGYHIILVGRHDQAGPPPKDQVREMLKGRRSRDQYEDFVEGLRSNATIEMGF